MVLENIPNKRIRKKKYFVKYKYNPKPQTVRFCGVCGKNTLWKFDKKIEHSRCKVCKNNWGKRKKGC